MQTNSVPVVSQTSNNGYYDGLAASAGESTDVHVETQIRQRLRLFDLCVEVLISQSKFQKFWVEGYREAIQVLESLPLTYNDFHLAKKHMENALCYSRRREFGAAAFELRIVRGHLQSI